MTPLAPIGIFDSGLGGLTVMSALMEAFPKNSMIYFGDTARLPYGEKSPESILRCALEITRFLIRQKIGRLVVACNTASAHALKALQSSFPLPITGVIEAGCKAAAEATETKEIAILATRATLASGAYQGLLTGLLPDAVLYPIACPLFVPFVEENLVEHPACGLIIEEYLLPLKRRQIDTVLLGCTHYPLLQEEIQKRYPHCSIIDSAHAAASALKGEVLEPEEGEPLYSYFVSDNPERFRRLASLFLKHEVGEVGLCPLEPL